MAEKGRVFSGPRAKLLLNGKKVAYVTRVSGTETIEYFPIEAIDNIEVEEHVPIRYTVDLQASMVRLVGETMKSEGFFPPTGKNPESHLQNILLQGDLSLTIEDSKEGKVVLLAQDVKIQSKNVAIEARGAVFKDVTMVATRIQDESEV